MDYEEKAMFLSEMGLESSGLGEIVFANICCINNRLICKQCNTLEQLCLIFCTFNRTSRFACIKYIAGLVKGASKGEGLGNKFLSNIRECDAIVHVVRCFDNGNQALSDTSYRP